MQGLMLHCGAQPLTRSEVALIDTPEPLGARHKPVPYIDYIDAVTDNLSAFGMTIKEESFGALKNGSRFFGLMQLAAANGDFATVVGLRASHDQSFARSIAAGSSVFVCDNLCFSGEVQLSTRQTLNIEDRLPGMILNAVETLPGLFEVQEQRYGAYKEKEIRHDQGDAALIELVRRNIMPASLIPRALGQWDEPEHEEHAQYGNSVWRLMNSVTEAMKAPIDPETNLPTRAATPAIMERTVRMTKFLDEITGFDLVA